MTKRTNEKWNLVDRFARRVVLGRLRDLSNGVVEVRDAQSTALGSPGELEATIQVRDPSFYRQAAFGGTLSVAESYFNGLWDCDDLTRLFRVFIRNIEIADRFDSGIAAISKPFHKLYHAIRGNTRRGSRHNIRAHYDIGNEFFKLWLDDSLAYSSAVFAQPEATLAQGSAEKFDRICRKLDFRHDDQVIEIGGGWGGFAAHAAGQYGCHVTTTTISDEQLAEARRRIGSLGLAARVTTLGLDYRDLGGAFDKLVSIEMIEAVGHRNLDHFFRKCGELLRPDGTMLIQAIVMPERRYQKYLRSVDFIQRFVFPGGCLPSIGTMLESIGRTTDLRLVHSEDLAPHYAETLRRWRVNFQHALPQVRALGHSDEFIRLWTYYLCYCEALFEERYVGVNQLVFDKPAVRRDPIEITVRAANRQNDIASHRDAPREAVDIDGFAVADAGGLR